MSRKSFWTGVAALAAGLIFVTGGGAATTTTVTLTVNSTADSTTPCTITSQQSTGTCTLRGAVLAADGYQQDNTIYVIKLAAKTYKLSLGEVDIDAWSANSGNLVEIVGAVKTTGKGKHKKTAPASIIDGSDNAKPASVFTLESPTQMSNVVITGGTGNPATNCYEDGGNVWHAGCGGGIYVDSSLDLQNSVVQGNTACDAYTGNQCTGTYVFGGGIYVPHDGTSKMLTLYKTTVTGNVAYGGGGIFNAGYPATVLIKSSHLDKNTACRSFSNGMCDDYGFGGGIANFGEQVSIDQSTVNGNVAGSPVYGTGEGGGIYQWNDNMQLSHSTVSGNVAGYDGGGVYDDENIDFVSSTISHNIAGVQGGGVFLEYLASFDNSTLSSNTAGGTFECTGTKCKHTVSTTSDTCSSLYPSATKCTQSDGYGGAIYSDAEYPELLGSTVTKNVAVTIKGDGTNCGGGQGGGIYTDWTLSALGGTKFTDNSADCGGAIYNWWDGSFNSNTFVLSDTTLSGNSALEDGGAIWTGGGGSATLYGVTVTKNKAGRQTGGVWDDELGSVTLGTGTKLTKNTSKGSCKNLTWPCS